MIVAGSSLLFASLSPLAANQPRAVCRHAATAMNLIDGAVQLPVVADGVAAADGPALVQLVTAAAVLALVPARRLLQPQGLRDVYVRPGKGSHGVGLIAIRSVPKRAACAAAKTTGPSPDSQPALNLGARICGCEALYAEQRRTASLLWLPAEVWPRYIRDTDEMKPMEPAHTCVLPGARHGA